MISTKLKMFIASGLVIVALAVGLGVGIPLSHHHHHDQSESSAALAASSSSTGVPSATQTSSTPTSNGSGNVSDSTIWQPAVGSQWQIELAYTLNDTAGPADIYDIDLFDTPAEKIKELQALGRKVICYFSAGSYENWRPDASDFQPADLGNGLDGWPGENWLNTSSSNVRKIMANRLDLAKTKLCDGVDPDNVDGYNNDNGLGLTESDAINYVDWLADEAHSRGISLGLKNAGEIIPNVIDKMQWSVNEQCVQYDECDTFAPFIQAQKPVFHIEYPKGDSADNDQDVTASQKKTACDNSNAKGFSTVIKNMALDNWVEYC